MDLLLGILARNWQLKAAAFAIALLLWIVVRLDSANRQSIPARVEDAETPVRTASSSNVSWEASPGDSDG